MVRSINVQLCLPVPYDLYCQLFLNSEEAGVDFDVYVQLFFAIRALGLVR